MNRYQNIQQHFKIAWCKVLFESNYLLYFHSATSHIGLNRAFMARVENQAVEYYSTAPLGISRRSLQ